MQYFQSCLESVTCLSVRGLKPLPQEQDQEVEEGHKNTFRS